MGYKFLLPRFGSQIIFDFGMKHFSNPSIIDFITLNDCSKPRDVTNFKLSAFV